MARQKLVLGWAGADDEQVEVTLEGDMLKSNHVCKLFTEDDIGERLNCSFVAVQRDSCLVPGVFTFDGFYSESELQHMQEALRQIAGDGT